MSTRARWRYLVLIGLALASLFGFFLVGPIAQDPAYHRFADARAWLGIPSFGNVITNLPFALVGVLGLVHLRSLHPARSEVATARGPWAVFFAGVLLVAAGSAYYHWAPDDARLVWDRLPMTLGFIGLTVALIGEWVRPLARWLLPIGLALGVGSVLVWVATGDLRLYYGVQLLPMVVAAAVLVLFRAPFTRTWHLGIAVLFYAAAKLTEGLDAAIDEVTAGVISGHPLKHLLAGAASWWILDMLRRRAPRAAG